MPFDRTHPPSIRKQAFFEELQKGTDSYIMNPHTGPISDAKVSGIIIRLSDQTGNPGGFVGVSIRFSELENLWEKSSTASEHEIIIADREGKIHFASDPLAELTGKKLSEIGLAGSAGMNGGGDISINSDRYSVHSRKLKYSGLTIVELAPRYTFSGSYAKEHPQVLSLGIALFTTLFMSLLLAKHGRKLAVKLFMAEKDSYRLMEMIGHSNIAIAASNAETNQLMMVNDAFAALYGYSIEELRNKSVLDLFAPEFHEKIAKVITVIHEKGSHIFESIHLRKDGMGFPAEAFIAAVHDEEGKIVGRVATVQDITLRKQTEEALQRQAAILAEEVEERRRAEEALRRSEATIRNKLKAITEPEGDIDTLELSDIIDTEVLQSLMSDFHQLTGMLGAVLDVSGKVLVAVGWQDICTKFHRCHPDTLKNCIESDTILTHGVRPGTFKAYRCKNNMWDIVTPLMVGGRHVGNVFIGQFLHEGEIPEMELFRTQALRYGFDETEYLAALDRVPRFSRESVEAGMRFYARLAGIISTLSFSMIQQSRMLAEQKRAEEEILKYRDHLEELVKERTNELRAANLHLRELDRLKSMFIASMSHELRTPLNSIIGFTGIILMGMSGEISDVQRKQLGMVKKSARHLLDLINDVIDVSKIEAGKADLSFEVFDLSDLVREAGESFDIAASEKGLNLDFKMEGMVEVASDRRRVRQILINLIGNAVKFTETGTVTIMISQKTTGVDIQVSDTGVGMYREDLERLFQAFSRIHIQSRPVVEGTGLGLYLSQRIAVLLGGEITAESTPGRGSEFTFFLPWKYSEGEE
jgi:PAS domain S-box-containing protein